MEINLIFDIYCFRPQWAFTTTNLGYSDSRYRVYINDDLITERNWLWKNNIFLRENIWIYSDNSQYNLKLEPIIKNPAQASFSIENLIVNNKLIPMSTMSDNDLEISFKI